VAETAAEGLPPRPGPTSRMTAAGRRREFHAVFPARTELIILLAFFRIAEDLVGLVDLLEFFLGHLLLRRRILQIRVVLARELAARGYALHLVARDAERRARVAGEIRAAHGVAVEEIVLDLAQADGAERLYADVRRRRTEPLDLLVNNAGFGLYGEFADMPMPRIQEMLVLHLLTVTKLIRLILPEMRERRKGAIINVASVAGLLPLAYLSLYAATKAFQVSLAAAL